MIDINFHYLEDRHDFTLPTSRIWMFPKMVGYPKLSKIKPFLGDPPFQEITRASPASPCLREHAVGRPMQLMVFNPFAVCLDPWHPVRAAMERPMGAFWGLVYWAHKKVDGQFFFVCWGLIM